MAEDTLQENNEFVDADKIILEWKKQYGYTYVATLDEEVFIYRLLSFREYEDLRSQAEDKFDLDEHICESCVLDPILDWRSDIYAGFTTKMAQTILEESLLIGSEDPDKDSQRIIAEAEAVINNSFLKQIPLIIKHCFQEYTLDELELMPLPKQIELYGKAKWMLENLELVKLEFEKEEK